MEHQVGRTRSRESITLWILAIVFFGVGDIVSTSVGLAMGATEMHPFVGAMVEEYVYLAMIPLKAMAFGLCYWLWRTTPADYRIGIPLGLAILGIAVTAWNLHIIRLLG